VGLGAWEVMNCDDDARCRFWARRYPFDNQEAGASFIVACVRVQRE
jgi:hypothetical protein